MPHTDFPQTLDYLYRLLPMFQRDGASAYKKDLANTRELCWVLGLPQWKIKSIHIAGTNGKGSVSSMVASVMQEAGFKVGLYTSPHLVNFTERIRINGEPITEAAVVDFVDQMKPTIERIRPSFFELTVVMAFQYFAEQDVDIAIVETGMGGRLDSTNVIRPELCAVTNISWDHQEFLGDTLAAIAGEKAGIVKPYTPLVVGQRSLETDPVFEAKAASLDSPLIFAQDRFRAKTVDRNWQRQRIAVEDLQEEEISEWEVDLPGLYQQENLQTVFGIISAMVEDGWDIDETHIRQGLQHVRSNTGLRGRMEQLSDSPLTLCDVGHNEAGVKWVLEHLQAFAPEDLHIVWGMVSDKDHHKILSLLPANAHYYWVCPSIPRGLPAAQLQQKAQHAGLSGESYDTVGEGLQAAQAVALQTEGAVVFVGGSTFVVADVFAQAESVFPTSR